MAVPQVLPQRRHSVVASRCTDCIYAAGSSVGWRRWQRRLGLAAIAFACSMPGRPAAAQAVAEIQVTPESLTLPVGQKQTLFAAAFDRQGNVLPTARIAFVSSDTLIVRASDDGTVVGVRAGLAKVEATAQGHRAAVAVFVTTGAAPADAVRDTLPPSTSPAAGGATALTLDPPALSLLVGESAHFGVAALRSDGTAAAPVPLTWKSLRPGVATVAPDGTITAIAPGQGVVQASARGGLSATASVTVVPGDIALAPLTYARPPDALDTLRATVPSQAGRAIQGGLTWRSSDSTIARVGPTGIVQTIAAGEADIIATGIGAEQRVHVVVFRKPEILVLAPRPSTGPVQVPIGSTAMLSARALAVDSTPVPQAPIGWEVADTSIAGFDATTGMVTGRRTGSTSITARLAGFEPAVWVVSVLRGDIALDHERIGLTPGERVQVHARLVDSSGVTQGEPGKVTWMSDHPEIIGLGADGGLVAVAPGRARVTARTPWGKSASADVFVTGELLISSNRGGPGFRIYQIAFDHPDTLLALTRDSATSVQAVWSPDRTRIAFSDNRTGNFDIYVTDADGTNLRAVTSDPGSDGEPAWSADGTHIVYASVHTGASQIFSVPVEGGVPTPLTSSSGGNISPAVSPDGRSIAFVSARDGNYEIYLMDADGSNQRRVTSTQLREAAPHFFPNGDLAWLVDRGGRAGSAIVRQGAGATAAISLIESPATIVSFALSRDGTRLAWITGRIGAQSRSEFSLFLGSATPGAPAAEFPLRPGEQPVTPAF